MGEAGSPKSEPEDRLITIQELAEITGLNQRTLEQARVAGRFLLDVVRPSTRAIRVRLSDARAVVRGEKRVMDGEVMSPASKKKIHTTQAARRAAKKGGAT